MKPPIQMKEKQWNERFFLGKLSDYEIKKQFVIKKKKAKRPTSSVKIIDEKSIPFQIAELQLLWDKLQIPHFHQAYFLQYNDKDLDLILRETSELKIKQAPVQKLNSLIKGRERCLTFLKNEEFEENKFSELMSHLRILTVNVLEQYSKWRDNLNKNVRWRINDIDYLVKLKTDIDFLSQYYEEFQRDPFMFWVIKLGTNQNNIHSQHHQISREMLRRIRECELFIIETDFIDRQKINQTILSRKEAQLVAKYLKQDEEILPILQKSHQTLQKQTKQVQMQETQTLTEIQILSKEDLNQILDSIQNDLDIESSFPYNENIFNQIDFTESLILQFIQNQQLVGLCICVCETTENTKKWIIEQIKLNNIQLFGNLLKEITNKLNGNEITIKLVHYQQQDEKFIDCEYLKKTLKEEGFRWKQQTNDSQKNIRYTIYYKKKEYQNIQKNNLLSFHFQVYDNEQSSILLQNATYLSSNLQNQSNIGIQFKKYIDSRALGGNHIHNISTLIPSINQNQIILLDQVIKMINVQTEVKNQHKYFRIIQDDQKPLVSTLNDSELTLYQIKTFNEDFELIITNKQIDIQNYDFKQGLKLQKDLLIPMFKQSNEMIDVFNHYTFVEFSRLIPYQKENKKDCIVLNPPFYFNVVHKEQVICHYLIEMNNLLKFQPTKNNITNQISVQNNLEAFPLNDIPEETINIELKNNNCICAIDPISSKRRWVIYTISNCLEQDFKELLEQFLTQLIQIDPNIQEVAINCYHKIENNEFLMSKVLDSDLQSLGFISQQIVNVPNTNQRYTEYLLTLHRDVKQIDDLILKHICTQESSELNLTSLISQFSIFHSSLTQSQLIVKRNNLVPFSKFYNKDIPNKQDVYQMLETNIEQLLTDCKYGSLNGQDFVIFNKSIISCVKNEEIGFIFFIQLDDVILTLNQVKSVMPADQITNIILKTQENKEEQQRDLALEFISLQKTGINYILEIELNISKFSTVKPKEFQIISKPYFIGIIEPHWFERHNQMIASMIIL